MSNKNVFWRVPCGLFYFSREITRIIYLLLYFLLNKYLWKNYNADFWQSETLLLKYQCLLFKRFKIFQKIVCFNFISFAKNAEISTARRLTCNLKDWRLIYLFLNWILICFKWRWLDQIRKEIRLIMSNNNLQKNVKLKIRKIK